jgi:hypothetical protein
MKLIFSFSIALFLITGCGTRESIKNKYLYSNKVKEVLTDEEYYKLDKEAKWPLNIHAPDCSDDIESDIIEASG